MMPELPFTEIDAAAVRQSYERLLAEHQAAIPNTPPERLIYAWDAVANDARELAFVMYVSDEPLDRVRALLVTSARAHLELLKLRGTSGVGSAGDRPLPSQYSTGNSCSTYLAICMALIGGEIELAQALALLVWDPQDAKYVGPNSVLCTNQQQACAYALKHLLLNEKQHAELQLQRLSMQPEDHAGELLLLQALVVDRSTGVVDGLSQLLASHARAAAMKENIWIAQYFLCIPGLGLAALALQRGLVTREQLPANNVYFPADLIAV